MNVALAPFVVEGLLILAAAFFGISLGRRGKPYGKIKLIIHLFFFVWLSTGYFFILVGTLKSMSSAFVPVAIMGIALVCQLIAGILMLMRKRGPGVLRVIHGISASVMLLADICGLVLVAIH
jgi:hypothetical protein